MSDARQDLPSDMGADVPVESILCTEALKTRVSRPPDYETESRALVGLAQAFRRFSPHRSSNPRRYAA